ncbi:hypothetical protein CIN_15840 [Commensalibacter intestini A911]|uniref:DUF4238 domain-containing protein n=1 Tax=Commensalibacter intestini A911 TaxID=1088868 RepID=G6F1T8_9PROT|nr:DUF4238 domain-containing protein [Commensalibacter intestini]EHD13392.1 hypothetical protein CIN_15840 [Commensalibacter intestini A911]
MSDKEQPAENKKQHFVPQIYLRQFCESNNSKKINQYNRKEKKDCKVPISTTCQKHYFYGTRYDETGFVIDAQFDQYETTYSIYLEELEKYLNENDGQAVCGDLYNKGLKFAANLYARNKHIISRFTTLAINDDDILYTTLSYSDLVNKLEQDLELYRDLFNIINEAKKMIATCLITANIEHLDISDPVKKTFEIVNITLKQKYKKYIEFEKFRFYYSNVELFVKQQQDYIQYFKEIKNECTKSEKSEDEKKKYILDMYIKSNIYNTTNYFLNMFLNNGYAMSVICITDDEESFITSDQPVILLPRIFVKGNAEDEICLSPLVMTLPLSYNKYAIFYPVKMHDIIVPKLNSHKNELNMIQLCVGGDLVFYRDEKYLDKIKKSLSQIHNNVLSLTPQDYLSHKFCEWLDFPMQKTNEEDQIIMREIIEDLKK